MTWLVQPIGKLRTIQFTAGEAAHVFQFRLDRGKYIAGQCPAQITAQQAVIAVLVPELWRWLVEGHLG
jgi:hypothetical protein